MLAALCHSAKTGWREVQDLSEMSELRVRDDNLLWAEADVSKLTQEDIDLIAEEFDLDALAVEDAIHTRQRPKFEDYPSHIFVVFHELQEVADQLEAVQLACFIGNRFVLTLHDGAERTIGEAKRRWGEAVDEPPRDPSDLLHTLLDVVVDDYQDFADTLESDVETIEEIVLDNPHLPVQRQLYSLKQRVSRMRRYALPASRVMDWALGENRLKPLSHNTRSLFRDVHDHLLRITDQIHNIDELTQAVLDLTRAARGDALSETSKKLTAWAAIFAVGTLIAGVYGMNFELVPASGQVFGFWFALALMAVSGIGLYVYFKKRGWI
jgi:magnesium transporter